jgi:hypothetical protein
MRWAALLGVIVLLSALRARAEPSGRLRTAHSTPIELVSEELSFRCEPNGARELDCVLRVRWELRNPTGRAQEVGLLLNWEWGATHRASLTSDEELNSEEVPVARAARVRIGANETREVTLVVEQAAGEPHAEALGIPRGFQTFDPLHARHPLLAPRWELIRRGFEWATPSEMHFASVGPTRIFVQGPAGWRAAATDGEGVRDAEGRSELVASADAQDGVRPVFLERGFHNDIVRHGGPFLALGAAIDKGFRARVGYELGISDLVLVQVALDTDFSSQLVAAALLEVASWSAVILPSVSFGVGVPVQIRPDVRPGLRLEASATLFAAAFVATLDLWPQSDGGYTLTLLGRVGI